MSSWTLLCSLMTDPVLLPSENVVDRSTICAHLLNDANDPFTRVPLAVEDLVPHTELKERIDAWLAERRSSRS